MRGQDGPRVEVTGWWWWWWVGFGVTTNLLHFTDTTEKGERKGEEEEKEEARERDTTPAILFLSSAATAFVAMTTQADDLIAVASECRSLKEPVTRGGSSQTPHRQGSTAFKMILHRCRDVRINKPGETAHVPEWPQTDLTSATFCGLKKSPHKNSK